MPIDPKIPQDLLRKIKPLENELLKCVKTLDFNKAKKIVFELQNLLKSRGITSRLAKDKNILYEVALEVGKYEFAISGCKGNRQLVSSSSRMYLEATAILAICYIRKGNLDIAKQFYFELINKINNIKSDSKRREFQKKITLRIEDEIALYLLKNSNPQLVVEEIHNQAINLIQNCSEEQIYELAGQSIPNSTLELFIENQNQLLKLIPPKDKKALPEPIKQKDIPKLGKRFTSAIKRVIWKAICNPNSEIYKAWSEGLSIVHDKKWISIAVINSLMKFSIGIPMIAASIIALAVRFGVDVFCETFAPEDIMELR